MSLLSSEYVLSLVLSLPVDKEISDWGCIEYPKDVLPKSCLLDTVGRIGSVWGLFVQLIVKFWSSVELSLATKSLKYKN